MEKGPACERPVPETLLGEVLWRRLDEASFERCRVSQVLDFYMITGTVLTVAEGEPFQLQYLVQCDLSWTTQNVRLQSQRRAGGGSLHLTRDASGGWTRGGEPLPAMQGLTDIDLQISPSTNTLPIRRLGLPVGSRASMEAVWIRFPGLSIERLPQEYTRVSESHYHYESNGGRFRSELEVDAQGIVVRYGDIWERVAP